MGVLSLANSHGTMSEKKSRKYISILLRAIAALAACKFVIQDIYVNEESLESLLRLCTFDSALGSI